MQKLKNRLTGFIRTFLFIIIPQLAFAGTTPILPQSGIISEVSEKIELSINNSNVIIELQYIYIPQSLIPDAIVKIKELAIHKEFNFNYTDDKPNRYGNLNAVVTPIGSKKSLQETLLESGFAFAYFLDSPEHPEMFFKAEEKARNTNKGIWKDFHVLNSNAIPEDYKEDCGKFVIVEGRAENLYISKKNTYVNFGKDWKTDFTIQFENKILKKFPDFSAQELVDKKVRVRGWLEDYNGPFIKIQNPENVEIYK